MEDTPWNHRQTLPALVAYGRQEWAGATIRGAISGPGWVSLRTDRGFLWLLAMPALRAVFFSDESLPRRWLDLLGRHHRSPFAAPSTSTTIVDLQALGPGDGRVDGFELHLQPGPLFLRWRSWPRPGAIWLADAVGNERARWGRMEGPPLTPVPARKDPDFDPQAHALDCRATIEAHLRERTARTLRTRVRRELERCRRRVWSIEGDLSRAEADRGARAKADLLAAHLHELRAGMSSAPLISFEGDEVEIELDPALPPAANLERWYHRARRAERKIEQVTERLHEARAALDAAAARAAELEDDPRRDLDDWLDWAQRHGLDPLPRERPLASERGRPDPARLPYWSFRLDGFELRVGRSARDNDELLRRYSHGRDLWLHAQGVPGSHVILRSAGAPVPERTIERAARVAAQYSRARTSALVPVLVTERRYVRKPRKAAPGQVVAERERSLFVEPGVPEGCERTDPTEAEPDGRAGPR